MRFEDMKNNIPETPEFIHVMIQNEVDRHCLLYTSDAADE
mgnify:CR=1 FL=1